MLILFLSFVKQFFGSFLFMRIFWLKKFRNHIFIDRKKIDKKGGFDIFSFFLKFSRSTAFSMGF